MSETLKSEIEKNKIVKCAKIAQKGIELSAIYEEVVVYNNWRYDRDPQFRCFKNAEGRDLKGAFICSMTIKDDKNDFGRNLEEKELFLMEDGTLKVFIRKRIQSYLLDEESKDLREVSSDQDISCFDYDEIIEKISEELKKRLKKVGKRTKTQTARIEKFNKLIIST